MFSYMFLFSEPSVSLRDAPGKYFRKIQRPFR